MIKKFLESPLGKRLTSLIWRAVMMGLATFVAILAQNVASLEINPLYVTIIGLILGEISKYLNNYIKGKYGQNNN